MTSCEKTLKNKILSLSESLDFDRAKEEWTPVFFNKNSDFYYKQEIGYFKKNDCNYKEHDKCRCVLGNLKRDELSTKTEKPKKPEHCRWVNYRNLNLFQNSTNNYSCICKEPIIYVYQIKNKINGNLIPSNPNESGIGSSCIKKFLPSCYKELSVFIDETIRINEPEKHCFECGKKHNRKKTLIGEIQNCKACPNLCCILDCVNHSYKKKLCMEHLGLKKNNF